MVDSSSDGSDTDRNSAMRKRNASRRKRKRVKSDPPEDSARSAPHSPGPQTSKPSNSDSSSAPESDYVRTKRKLRHSVEATNRRLRNIADEMATAIEHAQEFSDSDCDDDNDDKNVDNSTSL